MTTNYVSTCMYVNIYLTYTNYVHVAQNGTLSRNDDTQFRIGIDTVAYSQDLEIMTSWFD